MNIKNLAEEIKKRGFKKETIENALNNLINAASQRIYERK